MVTDDVDETAAAHDAVVIVNYGSHAMIERNFGALELGSAELIVVDNLTTAAERTSMHDVCRAHGWRFVAADRNLGFGAAVNLAVRELWADGVTAFVIANPDCVLTAPVLTQLCAEARRCPDALVSPRLHTVDARVAFAGAVINLSTGEIRGRGSVRPFRRLSARRGREAELADWLPGTCLAVHRDLLARIGGFAEEYFLYWEDVELSYRCVRAGGRLVVRDDLAVTHDSGATQGPQHGRAKSAVYYRYNCRNRLVFAAANLNPAAVLGWMLLTPLISWEILMRGGRRQLLRSWRPAWAALRGSLEGLGVALGAVVRRRRATSTIARFAPLGALERPDAA